MQSLMNARSLKLQPRRAAPTNTNLYSSYDSERLNNINSIVVAGYPLPPGEVRAVLDASNSTATPTSSGVVASATSTPNASSNSGGSGSSSTALAMYDLQQHYFNTASNHSINRIVLYAITGCVSALFCVVIVTGVSPVQFFRVIGMLSLNARLSELFDIPNAMGHERALEKTAALHKVAHGALPARSSIHSLL